LPAAASFALLHGETVPVDALMPDERGQLAICGDNGTPHEAAVL